MTRTRNYGTAPEHTKASRLASAAVSLLVAVVVTTPALAYEGFGTTTPGGAGHPIVRVTTLASSGPGSLRSALSEGHRVIVFDVAGDIELDDHLYVRGPFVTIDGFSAPRPGITLRHRGLIIRGTEGAHDVIVRGLRVRDANIDGIQVTYGAHNVIIDHVSVAGAADGNIDITEGAHDVTVSWSILASPRSRHSMLVKYHPERVSLHHNLFVNSPRQNPDVGLDTFGSPTLETTIDMRNNVIWSWGSGFGTKIHSDARANVIANLYFAAAASRDDQNQAIIVCTGNCPEEPSSGTRAHASSNVSVDTPGFAINSVSTDATPFPAPFVTTEDACLAGRQVRAEAGVRPLDPVDEAHLGGIDLPWCPAIFVEGVYHEAVRRNASDAEVQYWLIVFGPQPSAWTAWTAILALFDSAEARALPITPSGYIAAVYRAAHGHPAEPDVLALYTGQLLDRWNAMLPALLEAPEFTESGGALPPNVLVGRLYQEALGRSPSAAESDGWAAYLQTTGDVVGVARAFFNSDEYTARPRTMAEHVATVYRALLGRAAADPEITAGVDYMSAQLGTLSPRGEDVNAFVSRVTQVF